MEQPTILVWDLPVRLFHWLLALSFAGAFLTAESERWRDVHVALGYTCLGLVAFRLVWGLVGSRYARFGAFAFGPGEVLRYLKSLPTRKPLHYVGHNPAGSWMIYALLAAGLMTGASGYANLQDLGGKWLEELHEGAANTMLALVIVHVGGVIISSIVHRENLVRGMVTGYKSGPASAAIGATRWISAVVLLAIVTAFLAGALDVPGLPPLVAKAASVSGKPAPDRFRRAAAHGDD